VKSCLAREKATPASGGFTYSINSEIGYVGGLEAYVKSFLILTLHNHWQFSLKKIPFRLKHEYHSKM
jgi:hypothetical protein